MQKRKEAFELTAGHSVKLAIKTKDCHKYKGSQERTLLVMKPLLPMREMGRHRAGDMKISAAAVLIQDAQLNSNNGRPEAKCVLGSLTPALN